MTDILCDTIELIQATAVNASRKRIIQSKTPEPPHIYFTVEADGSLVRREAAPAPTADSLFSLDAVIAYAVHWEATEVYYGDGLVTVIIDDTRRDTAKLRMVESEQWQLLSQWQKTPRSYTQKEFLMLLRTTLVDSLPGYPGLRASLAKIKAETTGAAEAEVQHGRESMSRAVTAKASGTGEIPEELLIDVPIYTNPGETAVYPIRCALIIDPSNVTFTVKPVPGDMVGSVQAHEADIGNRLYEGLKGQETAVVYGRP